MRNSHAHYLSKTCDINDHIINGFHNCPLFLMKTSLSHFLILIILTGHNRKEPQNEKSKKKKKEVVLRTREIHASFRIVFEWLDFVQICDFFRPYS